MNDLHFSDYYPVFLDFAERTSLVPSIENEQVAVLPVSDSDFSIAIQRFNAEELVQEAMKSGFSKFENIILLCKKSFEGFVFMNYHITTLQLIKESTLLIQDNPEPMLLRFLENLELFAPSASLVCSLLGFDTKDQIQLGNIIQYVIVNELIRFPVSLFNTLNISETISSNLLLRDQEVELASLLVGLIGEYEFSRQVDQMYFSKYASLTLQIKLLEDASSHFLKRLALAISIENIGSEAELDKLMYDNLIETRMQQSGKFLSSFGLIEPANSEHSIIIKELKLKTRVLFRYVCKNAAEVFKAPDDCQIMAELNHFMETSNSIFNEQVSDLSEALLQNTRMFYILVKVMIYRKINGLNTFQGSQLISAITKKLPLISKDDFHDVRQILETKIANIKIESKRDFKARFINDDMFDIHCHYLQHKMAYLKEQLIQIKNQTHEVLITKSRSK